MQSDYITRSTDTLNFYLAVVDPQTISNKTWSRFMNSFSTAAETSNKTFAYADYFSLFKEDNFFVREREFISSMNSFDPSTIINLDTTAKKKSHSIIFRVMPRNTLFLRMGSFQQNGLLRNTI